MQLLDCPLMGAFQRGLERFNTASSQEMPLCFNPCSVKSQYLFPTKEMNVLGGAVLVADQPYNYVGRKGNGFFSSDA